MARAVDSNIALRKRILEFNEKLKAAGIRLKIEARGESLSLRGMFPPKPGVSTTRKKVQTYFATGEKNTKVGLAAAYNLALQVWSQLNQGNFEWADWIEVKDYRSCEVWIEKYRRYWLRSREDNLETREKFQNSEWKFALKYLPPEEQLTPEVLIEAAQLKKPNTRSRQLLVQGLTRFAKFAEIAVDLSTYKGKYSASSVKDRIIPTDAEILGDREKFLGHIWQIIFDRMILYGLRDHEAFLCEISDSPPYLCEVLDGKTGPRKNIVPAYQEWAEEWQPWAEPLPQVKVDGLTRSAAHRLYGERTSRQFRRLKIASDRTPYSYRHAYALRLALVYKFSVAESAQMMGHSPAVYLNTYSRHLDSHRTLENYNAIIESENRPTPPSLEKAPDELQ